ncbi:unnamed protein product [Nesidiocoris tenuis]|uniref:Uncharacterized protein n=1 Tax=Nesidiocoris tenuis TaxID=355587 RepID=A0A6H5G8L3_9HEMI|nr:unnamed protein product [Nesidiocoris tenuis]
MFVSARPNTLFNRNSDYAQCTPETQSSTISAQICLIGYSALRPEQRYARQTKTEMEGQKVGVNCSHLRRMWKGIHLFLGLNLFVIVKWEYVSSTKGIGVGNRLWKAFMPQATQVSPFGELAEVYHLSAACTRSAIYQPHDFRVEMNLCNRSVDSIIRKNYLGILSHEVETVGQQRTGLRHFSFALQLSHQTVEAFEWDKYKFNRDRNFGTYRRCSNHILSEFYDPLWIGSPLLKVVDGSQIFSEFHPTVEVRDERWQTISAISKRFGFLKLNLNSLTITHLREGITPGAGAQLRYQEQELESGRVGVKPSTVLAQPRYDVTMNF